MKQLSGSSGLQFFEPGGSGPGEPDVPVDDGEPVGVGVMDGGAVPVGPAGGAGGVDAGGDDAAEPARTAEEWGASWVVLVTVTVGAALVPLAQAARTSEAVVPATPRTSLR